MENPSINGTEPIENVKTEVEESILKPKPKKVRTEAQMASFEKARLARMANIKKRNE